jgi:hypothetical protein
MNFTLVTIPAQPLWIQFLGPIASIIAAMVAGYFAYRLQGLQKALGASQIEVAQASKDVAKAQADIALDKLKLDLFNRRFDLYTEALRIAVETVKSYNSPPFVPIPFERLDRLNKASFVFSPEAANRIDMIRATAENIGVYSERFKKMQQEGSPQLDAQGELSLLRSEN